MFGEILPVPFEISIQIEFSPLVVIRGSTDPGEWFRDVSEFKSSHDSEPHICVFTLPQGFVEIADRVKNLAPHHHRICRDVDEFREEQPGNKSRHLDMLVLGADFIQVLMPDLMRAKAHHMLWVRIHVRGLRFDVLW